jgi:hypothetical protein
MTCGEKYRSRPNWWHVVRLPTCYIWLTSSENEQIANVIFYSQATDKV